MKTEYLSKIEASTDDLELRQLFLDVWGDKEALTPEDRKQLIAAIIDHPQADVATQYTIAERTQFAYHSPEHLNSTEKLIELIEDKSKGDLLGSLLRNGTID